MLTPSLLCHDILPRKVPKHIIEFPTRDQLTWLSTTKHPLPVHHIVEMLNIPSSYKRTFLSIRKIPPMCDIDLPCTRSMLCILLLEEHVTQEMLRLYCSN